MGAAAQFRTAFPPPLLFPPVWKASRAVKTEPPRPVATAPIPTESRPASPALEDKSPAMAERKIKIAARLRLGEANTCKNMQMSPAGSDSRPWLFARRQSRAATRRLT